MNSSESFNRAAPWSSPNSRPPPGPPAANSPTIVLGHAMASNDLDAIRDLAAAAGATDLTRHTTPIHWLGLIAAPARRHRVSGPKPSRVR